MLSDKDRAKYLNQNIKAGFKRNNRSFSQVRKSNQNAKIRQNFAKLKPNVKCTGNTSYYVFGLDDGAISGNNYVDYC